MIIRGHRTLLVRCHYCGRVREYDLNIFNVCKNKGISFSCKCGKENIVIKKKEKKTYSIEVLCFACGHRHLYKRSLRDLIYKNSSFSCVDGTRSCFIGDSDVADAIINDYDLNFAEMLSDTEFEDFFNNFKILIACLNKIDRLYDKGRIECDCGNEDINIEIFSDRIEISCSNCGSVQIVYAETEEDLDIISKKRRITMHKSSISYIDSIIEKNKDLK